MADMVVAYLGWNSSSQGWNVGTWGNDAALPGSTGSAGSVVVAATAVVPVTGLTSTGSVGSVAVTAAANVDVTGIAATGSPGAVTVTGTALFDVTGVAGTGSVGSVAVTAAANVDVTGLSATGQVGGVLVWGRIVPNQIPEYSGTTPLQTPGYTNIAA